MRIAKLVLFAALAAGWWQLWHARDAVVDAYTEERPLLALELAGVDAALIDAEPTASPFSLTPAGTDRSLTTLPTTSSSDDIPVEEVTVTGGDVRLAGTVRLPDGTPVAGATVRIDRVTSRGQATAETVSQADGTWEAEGLRGGRLRVRAFAPNELASVDPSVLVVSRTGNAVLELQVVQPDVVTRYEVVGIEGVGLAAQATFAVVASREAVDDLGRIVEVPVSGVPLDMEVSWPARLLSADVVVTDEGGAARFLMICDETGSPVGRLSVESEQPVLALPKCLTEEELVELFGDESDGAEDVSGAGSATEPDAEPSPPGASVAESPSDEGVGR